MEDLMKEIAVQLFRHNNGDGLLQAPSACITALLIGMHAHLVAF